VVIPKDIEERALQTAFSIEEAADNIMEATKKGQRLDEARKTYGYHKLQSR